MHCEYVPRGPILQANVELQFRPSKEHAFALQAPITKLAQVVSRVVGMFRSDQTGWTWSWHILASFVIPAVSLAYSSRSVKPCNPLPLQKLGGRPSNSCFLLAKPVRLPKPSGEFVESGTFSAYICYPVLMFHRRKAHVSRWNPGGGSILHQWRGGDPRDMRQA